MEKRFSKGFLREGKKGHFQDVYQGRRRKELPFSSLLFLIYSPFLFSSQGGYRLRPLEKKKGQNPPAFHRRLLPVDSDSLLRAAVISDALRADGTLQMGSSPDPSATSTCRPDALPTLTKPVGTAYNRLYFYEEEQAVTKALISVTGLDTTGIIARISTRLYEMNINILDITQTILGGYFTMMMVVDLDGAHMDFETINRHLQEVSGQIGMSIHMQRMDIFDAMHRI